MKALRMIVPACVALFSLTCFTGIAQAADAFVVRDHFKDRPHTGCRSSAHPQSLLCLVDTLESIAVTHAPVPLDFVYDDFKKTFGDKVEPIKPSTIKVYRLQDIGAKPPEIYAALGDEAVLTLAQVYAVMQTHRLDWHPDGHDLLDWDSDNWGAVFAFVKDARGRIHLVDLTPGGGARGWTVAVLPPANNAISIHQMDGGAVNFAVLGALPPSN